MVNYYSLDIIPIILNIFKVKNIVISGLSDNETLKYVFNYCDDNDASYIAIDSNNIFQEDFINDYTLNVLPDLNNYDAILINDDPNWYTIFNELNIIKQNNEEFPLVFICNNIFPHKHRDSYIDPDIIPPEFRNNYSKKFTYDDINLKDSFFHAIDEHTPKNGVLTAIEDFLMENPSIGIMDVHLLNGITILYVKNSISQIRLNKLAIEIENHVLDCDEFSDSVIKNQILLNNLVMNDNSDIIEEFTDKIAEKDEIINEYEVKIDLFDNKLRVADNQVRNADSKLNLKNSEIQNFESKLLNKDEEIDFLNKRLQNIDIEFNSLKNNFKQKEENFKSNESELRNRIHESESEINSLKEVISNKEQNESQLTNKLHQVEDSINKNEIQISDLKNHVKFKENQINIKENELSEKDTMLNFMKNKYEYQLSKLENKKYCIKCHKEEIDNNHVEMEYLRNGGITKKFLNPISYIYLIFKSKPHELFLNFKLYNAIKDSKCFDIGFYLNNNVDLRDSKLCKYFSPELHYVCSGFDEKRVFNKKYFNRNSKRELLDYITNCQ